MRRIDPHRYSNSRDIDPCKSDVRHGDGTDYMAVPLAR